MAVSTCRSEEIPLLMKAKARRSRSFDSGTTRIPRMADNYLIAFLEIAQAAAKGALGLVRQTSDHDHRVHALILHLDPLALRADEGFVIGGGVESSGAQQSRSTVMRSADPESAGVQPRSRSWLRSCSMSAALSVSIFRRRCELSALVPRSRTAPLQSGRCIRPPCRRSAPSSANQSDGLRPQQLPVAW